MASSVSRSPRFASATDERLGAHGDVVMVGALTALSAMTVVAAAGLGLPGPLVLVLALVVSMCVCMLLGFSIERIAYRPLRRAPRLAPLGSLMSREVITPRRRRKAPPAP